jgi:hypothetical protein
MSHRHFCDIAGHWWDCQGMAMRAGDTVPSVCMCLKCDVPLESGDHSHDYIELLACPDHWKVNETSTASQPEEPGAETRVFRGEDGKPIFGFCLWCNQYFYSMSEVEAHNADGMKKCPVYQELSNQPGGYPFMPPVLQDMLEQAQAHQCDEAGQSEDPEPKE